LETLARLHHSASSAEFKNLQGGNSFAEETVQQQQGYQQGVHTI
jgi:hypothetical protein